MIKKYFFLCILLMGSLCFVACDDESDGDVERIVEMTIYPETGYGRSFLSDVWIEPLIYSDSDDPEKQRLQDIIVEGFDFEYERGYQYKLLVKKVWMYDPPQDVSSIKYELVDLVSKEKVVTEDSEEEIELTVGPKMVNFMPTNPIEYEEDGQTIKVYAALHAINNSESDEANRLLVLKEIEGFNYKEGYEYVLNVKKMTQANPYSVKYKLIDVVSKKVKKPEY